MDRHVTAGVSNAAERMALRAEIEVAYTRALRLSSDDVRWIVGSFNERGAPRDLRSAIDRALEDIVVA